MNQLLELLREHVAAVTVIGFVVVFFVAAIADWLFDTGRIR